MYEKGQVASHFKCNTERMNIVARSLARSNVAAYENDVRTEARRGLSILPPGSVKSYMKCHSDLSIGIRRDDANFPSAWYVAATGSNTSSFSPIGRDVG